MQPVIITIDTPTLGDRSYLVHDGEVAFVVDPQRDIDRVQQLAQKAGVRITHVFETHLHNDYLTGGLALAQSSGAAYHVNGADEVSFERSPISDRDVVEVSPTMRVRALATPGHTFNHLSYAVTSLSPDGTEEPVAVFTGGSLLFGATGRPDLMGPEHTDELVRHQYTSVQRLASELPDDTQVMPTHGFGSFCSAGSTGETTESTIGAEKRVNPVLTDPEDQWVRDMLASLDDFPAYYAHMQPGNAAGPSAADLSEPEPADKEVITQRIEAGEWVVDLRHRTAFAAGHVGGSFNFGVDGDLATYLGWLIPWGSPLTLLGEDAEQVAEGQRELVRIGIDRFSGAATGAPESWTDSPLQTFGTATFADLAQVRHHRPVTVLDVRRVSEFADQHIEGALNIPIHQVLSRMSEVPDGQLWVHCAGGYRASIVASVLAANGRDVVCVDDDFADNAASSGLALTSAA